MTLLRGLHNLTAWKQPSVVTIGSFDGVHLGHQSILARLMEVGKQQDIATVAMIFEPQPQEFFTGVDAPIRLSPFRYKYHLLVSSGIDVVCCLRFNEALRQLTAQDFVDTVLIRGLCIRHLVVGDDFRFGCDRLGNFSFLLEAGKKSGFAVENSPTFSLMNARVSSSRVRQALAKKDVQLAARLLGRPFSIYGRVVHGQQLGRTIGTPTANVRFCAAKLPLKGVYVVTVTLSTKKINGVANLGRRPTVSSGKELLEVHLLDFDQQIYGQYIKVEFWQFLRDEKQFDSIEALKQQIQKDISEAKQYLAGQQQAGSLKTVELK